MFPSTHPNLLDIQYEPGAGFLDDHPVNPDHRAILMDWLMELAVEVHLGMDVVLLTKNYVDRCLATMPAVAPCDIQRIGAACFFVAAKFEEPENHPKASLLVHLSDNNFTMQGLLGTEADVLETLEFRLVVATETHFLDTYLSLVDAAFDGTGTFLKVLRIIAEYLVELSLPYHEFMKFATSLRAAAAVYLALHYLKSDFTTIELPMYPPRCVHVEECMLFFHELCTRQPKDKFTCAYNKYAQNCYGGIAKKLAEWQRPRPLAGDDFECPK